MNRRALARTAGHLVAPWLAPDESAESPPQAEISLLRFSHRAMATTFELLLPLNGQAQAVHDIFDLIDELETQLTVYTDDSDVSQLNAHAAIAPVAVEDRLFRLLSDCSRLTAETHGAFDVTAGPLIKAWGFFRRQGRVPSPTERQAALDCVGMKHVELNAASLEVRFLRSGIEINLGSIGKGYTLDRCKEILQSKRERTALLHGGGSSVLAMGSQPGDSRGWPIAIRHPWEEGRRLGIVHLRDRALGTSAATFQHFEYNRKRLSHLLDPRTGRPAEGIASATAIAPTAAEADALATAFYILGIDKTRLFCQSHPGIGAVLLSDGDDHPTVIGLTRHDFTPDERVSP